LSGLLIIVSEFDYLSTYETWLFFWKSTATCWCRISLMLHTQLHSAVVPGCQTEPQFWQLFFYVVKIVALSLIFLLIFYFFILFYLFFIRTLNTSHLCPLSSYRQHLSYGDCLDGKRGDYLTSSVLCGTKLRNNLGKLFTPMCLCQQAV